MISESALFLQQIIRTKNQFEYASHHSKFSIATIRTDKKINVKCSKMLFLFVLILYFKMTNDLKYGIILRLLYEENTKRYLISFVLMTHAEYLRSLRSHTDVEVLTNYDRFWQPFHS